jgi:hypothetical protein
LVTTCHEILVVLSTKARTTSREEVEVRATLNVLLAAEPPSGPRPRAAARDLGGDAPADHDWPHGPPDSARSRTPSLGSPAGRICPSQTRSHGGSPHQRNPAPRPPLQGFLRPYGRGRAHPGGPEALDASTRPPRRASRMILHEVAQVSSSESDTGGCLRGERERRNARVWSSPWRR